MDRQIVIYSEGERAVEVMVSPQQDTVWLTQRQMAELFDVSTDNIGLHIRNIMKDGELGSSTAEDFSVVQKEGKRDVKRTIKFYNLDMILSVGYRVNSKKGIAFRKWANSVLKQYLIEGYAVNQKRLEILNKTIDIQSKMLASALDIESADIIKIVSEYSRALDLLDDYDHGCVIKPEGTLATYKLQYDEARQLIDQMKFNNSSTLFGAEKEEGKLSGILQAIHQTAFGQELYPSVQEKAANLLYFIIKDHPFADGCKRIGATLFLEFLNKNNQLYSDGGKRISESALVAITLMIAESRPEEKEIMIKLVMNFLSEGK